MPDDDALEDVTSIRDRVTLYRMDPDVCQAKRDVLFENANTVADRTRELLGEHPMAGEVLMMLGCTLDTGCDGAALCPGVHASADVLVFAGLALHDGFRYPTETETEETTNG